MKNIIELATTKRRATSVEKGQELAEQKVVALQGKLEEAETKLAEATSIVLACDKELADLKETMKTSILQHWVH